MIGLRLMSLLAAILVLVLPPMLVPLRGGDMSGWIVLAALVAMALTFASFVYIGAAGKQMRRGGQPRMLGGLLLIAPVLASLTMLATRRDLAQLSASGALLAFTMLLLFSFVFRPTLGQRQRPMRERERLDPILQMDGR